MTERVRVLVLAEACNPEWASVPLVGWSMARALAEVADVHLVTQLRNRDALRRAGLREGTDFTALDTEAVARPLCQIGSWLRGGAGKGWTTVTALSALGYYYFESEVWRRFGPRVAAREFDIVHRVTPLSPTVPSLIASRCRKAGVPFILGPLNGGLAWPRGFERTRWQEREWLSYLRCVYKLLYGFRSTRRDAAALLIASKATWDDMPASYLPKCFYVPENAIDPRRFPHASRRGHGLPVRAVFVGRLVPYKGADLLLEAAAPGLRSGRLTLTVVGDGPQRPLLEALIRRLGVEAGVRLAGWVPHVRVREFLNDADVFTFPSVREFGGGVVLEAMASGLPPVVADYGGPGELVTAQTGWKVPIGPRGELVRQLRAALEDILQRPEGLAQKSEAAARRALTHFTWSAKARQVGQVYDWVLGRTPGPPACPMPLPDFAEPCRTGPSGAVGLKDVL
jgi:glycosyltransferase involved in cell wall biosynthesis